MDRGLFRIRRAAERDHVRNLADEFDLEPGVGRLRRQVVATRRRWKRLLCRRAPENQEPEPDPMG